MAEYFTRQEKAVIAKLEPAIKKMKPERAKEFSDLLAEMEKVGKAFKTLTRAIDDTKILEEKDLAHYAEGLSEADAENLKAWIKQEHDKIDAVYYVVPSSDEELYGKLSTMAIDVYYDAQDAAEEIAAKE